jgi:CheY-like chemotaxis protein
MLLLKIMSQIPHFILLVDDDPEDLEALQEALRLAGSDYEIIEAHNGEEALKQLDLLYAAGDHPSLIVLDINMPKIDGKQTLVAIQADKRFSTIPVVVFSTSSSPMDKMFFSHRNIELITKPFNLSTLVEAAAKLLSLCKD